MSIHPLRSAPTTAASKRDEALALALDDVDAGLAQINELLATCDTIVRDRLAPVGMVEQYRQLMRPLDAARLTIRKLRGHQ